MKCKNYIHTSFTEKDSALVQKGKQVTFDRSQFWEKNILFKIKI